MELTVLPINRTLEVRPGENLLAALRKYEVAVSYSCMAGRCGTCRCKVVKGQVFESGQESRTPLAGGERIVLACQTALTHPCAIEIPEPDEIVVHPARILRGIVTVLENLTHDVKRLRLRLGKPFSYSPGQYVQLQFTPGLTRPYSMAGLGSDDELEFHIRMMPAGRAARYIAEQLKPGDVVRITGPLGTAYLRRKHAGPIVCVAGSTGLAPILSIVRGALAAGMDNSIHVYFGVRTPRDVYGLEWLRELTEKHSNLRFHCVITSGNEDAGLRSGLVTEAVAQDLGDFSGARAYVCGPPAMVEATNMLMTSRGLLPEHVYADAFYPTGT